MDDADELDPCTTDGCRVSVWLRLYDYKEGQAAWSICWRDAEKHPSPNSGWPEAAMAGALGVQLGGVNEYGGFVEERATLGRS